MRPSVSGMPNSARRRRVVSSDTSSDFQYFCFFPLQKVVDPGDEVVVQLLQVLLGVLHVVFAGVLQLLETVASIGPRVANSDAGFLGELVNDLNQLSPPLFIQGRKRNAYRAALCLRVEPEI